MHVSGCQISCNWEATGANFSVFDLTRLGFEPPTFRIHSPLGQ